MLTAYNRTIAPLLAASDGRTIPGRSQGLVDETFGPVRRALAAGLLRDLSTAQKAPKPKRTAAAKKKAEPDPLPASEPAPEEN